MVQKCSKNGQTFKNGSRILASRRTTLGPWFSTAIAPLSLRVRSVPLRLAPLRSSALHYITGCARLAPLSSPPLRPTPSSDASATSWPCPLLILPYGSFVVATLDDVAAAPFASRRCLFPTGDLRRTCATFKPAVTITSSGSSSWASRSCSILQFHLTGGCDDYELLAYGACVEAVR